MNKEKARELCRRIEEKCGKKNGFVLFVSADYEVGYMSNCERAGVIEMLHEWLHETRGVPDGIPTPGYLSHLKKDSDPFRGYERLRLERMCRDIAEEIESQGETCLFLFDMEEGGNLAYHTNMPYARSNIKAWLERTTMPPSTITIGGKKT